MVKARAKAGHYSPLSPIAVIYIPIIPSLFPRVADSLGKQKPFVVEQGSGSFVAVLVLNGEESREDLGVSVDVCVLVDDLGLVEVVSGTLLDELVGVELVSFGVSLDGLELELGLCVVDSGFLLEMLV